MLKDLLVKKKPVKSMTSLYGRKPTRRG